MSPAAARRLYERYREALLLAAPPGPPTGLRLVGLGWPVGEGTSALALELIRECAAVFAPPEARALLEGLGPKILPLPKTPKAALEAARGEPVALAVPGHPLLDSALGRSAAKASPDLLVTPGLSLLGAAIADDVPDLRAPAALLARPAPKGGYRLSFQKSTTAPRPSPQPRVSLVGLGLPDPRAITLGGLAAMHEAKTVFVMEAGHSFYNALPGETISIGTLPEGDRGAAERRLAKRVLERAAKGPVAAAIYGNPMIYEPFCNEIAAACADAEVPWRAFGAVSTLDSILSNASLHGGRPRPIWITNADDFCARPAQTRALTVVFKACDTKAGLARALGRALKSYPKEHRAFIATVRNWGPLERSAPAALLEEAPLSRVARLVPEPTVYKTLVLPPLGA